jgi:hypothetical protein
MCAQQIVTACVSMREEHLAISKLDCIGERVFPITGLKVYMSC